MRSTACALAVMLVSATAVNAARTGGFADENGGTTGGAGGESVTATTGTEIHQALCSRAARDTPITIYVTGTITLDNTEKVMGLSCSTASDKIELKKIANVSIIGRKKAVFDQIGIHIRESSNIIIQNVHVKNVKKTGNFTSNGGDAIGMERSVTNVWVDHCTLEASGGESEGYDALCDMKKETKYVTVSYTIFQNSGRAGLVGSSDTDTGNGPVTFHHNLYRNINSRTPLLRSATAHAYNNYYTKILSSGLNPRNGGKVKVEGCLFKHAKNPLGTFYTDKMGSWDVKDNIFKAVTWGEGSAGPNVKSTTSISIPYSYKLDKTSSVKGIVNSKAGAGKGSYGTNKTDKKKKDKKKKDTKKKDTKKKDTKKKDEKKKSPAPKNKRGNGGSCGAWASCMDDPGCCPSGFKCYQSNTHYAQCRKDCKVKGWDCKKLG